MIRFHPLTVIQKTFFRRGTDVSVPLNRRDAACKVIDAEALAARILSTKSISNPDILLIVLRPAVIVTVFVSILALYPEPETGLQYIAGMLLILIPLCNWHIATRNRKAAELALLTSDIQHDQLNELVELSNWPNSTIRQVANYHLIRLLRDIAPGEHDDIIDANHLSLLVRRLTFTQSIVNGRLTSEILEMFTRTRYTQALPSAITLSRYSLRLSVRRAARVCKNSLKGSWRMNELKSDAGAPEELLPLNEQAVAPSKETLHEGTHTISMRRSFLIAAVLVCVPYGLYNIIKSALSHSWLLMLPYAFISASPLLLIGFTMYPSDVKRLRAVVKSSKLDDVGIMTESLEWPDFYCQQQAAKGLIKSLPRLKASDAKLLNMRHREILIHKLNYADATSQPQLLIAILHALEQIGDSTAIAAVERLAKCTPKNSGQVSVKEAAIHCLEYLPGRAVLNGANLTLLRPSQPAGEDGSDLLRSGSSSALSDEQLLRPGCGE